MLCLHQSNWELLMEIDILYVCQRFCTCITEIISQWCSYQWNFLVVINGLEKEKMASRQGIQSDMYVAHWTGIATPGVLRWPLTSLLMSVNKCYTNTIAAKRFSWDAMKAGYLSHHCTRKRTKANLTHNSILAVCITINILCPRWISMSVTTIEHPTLRIGAASILFLINI